MLGRILLPLVLLAVSLGGCAASSEERLAKVEADIIHLQAQDIRLAILEDAVANIIAGRNAVTGNTEPENALPARSREPERATPAPAESSPRRAEPLPVQVPASPRASVSKPVPAKSTGSAPQEYQTALATLEAGRPGSAKALFKNFMASYPAHTLAPNAGYWLGECYYTQREYDSAIVAFKDVVAEFPAHNKAADAMLKVGYSYLQLGDTANARFYFEALLKYYPLSKPATLAREKLTLL